MADIETPGEVSDELNAPAAVEDEGTLLPDDPTAAFAALMDVMVADSEEEAADEAAGEADAAPAGGGSGEPADQGDAAPAADPATPDTGDGGESSVPNAEATLNASDLTTRWGELRTGLETRQRKELEESALADVREEYGKYFEALQKHPRELVGTEVPDSTGEGMVVLRDSADAQEFQEMVKQQLYREVQERARLKTDEVRPMMETLHNSIAIFEKNPDLIPGTRQFDATLANRFAQLAKPYELVVDGKLSGYSIPVQPLIDQVRSELKAKPAAPAAPSKAQEQAAQRTRTSSGQFAPVDPPQAGVLSKAGSSAAEPDDFSTLFGSIGLPDFRI